MVLIAALRGSRTWACNVNCGFRLQVRAHWPVRRGPVDAGSWCGSAWGQALAGEVSQIASSQSVDLACVLLAVRGAECVGRPCDRRAPTPG